MSYNQTSNISVTATTLNNGMFTLPTSSGTYTITTTGYGYGAGTATTSAMAGSWGTHTPDADVTITRPGGREIKVGALLDQLMDLLMFIPDDERHKSNPALMEAYKHHQQLIRQALSNDSIKESYESYMTLKKLVSQEEDA